MSSEPTDPTSAPPAPGGAAFDIRAIIEERRWHRQGATHADGLLDAIYVVESRRNVMAVLGHPAAVAALDDALACLCVVMEFCRSRTAAAETKEVAMDADPIATD
jgi:hypothetical protein